MPAAPVVQILVSPAVAQYMSGWIDAHRPPGAWEPGPLTVFLDALAEGIGQQARAGRPAPAVVDVPLPAGPVAEGDRDTPGTMTGTQASMLKTAFEAAGIVDGADRLNIARARLNAPELESSAGLSFNQAGELIGILGHMAAEGRDEDA